MMFLHNNGKLKSGTAQKKLPFPRNIYKRSGPQKVAENTIWSESMNKYLHTHIEVLK